MPDADGCWQLIDAERIGPDFYLERDSARAVFAGVASYRWERNWQASRLGTSYATCGSTCDIAKARAKKHRLNLLIKP